MAPLSPKSAARLELARAVGGGLCVPLRYAAHLVTRRSEMAHIRADIVAGAGRVDEPPTAALPKERPLRVFVGAAEASGEIHAASLVRSVRKLAAAQGAPEPVITAIGGERLRALGVEPLADPVARARTGFDGVLQSLPYYAGVLERAAEHARDTNPDVFVPVDSPALHVPMARMVRGHGVPVVHLVAPQYWGWAPWRVGAYRRAVDLALTLLPHEPSWFSRHRVNTRHVGHPLLDALADVPVTHPDPASRMLAILPGSRTGVIERNLPWMLEALGPLREAAPGLDVAVLQSTEEHRELIESISAGRARLETGDLHEQLAHARAAFAVSGTVLTDALHHRLPHVVVYRIAKRFEEFIFRRVLTTPYFASTNLLAGREVVPEHCFRGDGPRELVGRQLVDTWQDGPAREAMTAGIDDAAARLGEAGAIERAARHVLAVASGCGRT